MQTSTLPTRTGTAAHRARLIALIGCALVVLGLGLLHLRVRNSMMFFNDFAHDYVSAQAFRDGRSIYSEFTQADLSSEKLGIPGGLYRPGTFTNIHPPLDALLFAPLTLLSYDKAILVWSVLSCGLFLWIGHTVLRELRIMPARHWRLLLLGLGLCWYPFQAHIALGQLSLTIVACLVGAWVLLRHGREGWAGILIGLACLIKLYPGVLVVYLLLRRRWRALAVVCAVGALGLVLSVLIFGFADVLRYFTQGVSQAAGEHTAGPTNLALTGVFGRLLTDGLWITPIAVVPRVSTTLVLLSSIGLLALMSYQLWRAPMTQEQEDNVFILPCLAMLLISPITWQHILTILILPFGLMFQSLRGQPNAQRMRLTLLALTLVSLPDVEVARGVMSLYEPYRAPWYAGLALLGSTIGLFLMWYLISTRRYTDTAA